MKTIKQCKNTNFGINFMMAFEIPNYYNFVRITIRNVEKKRK